MIKRIAICWFLAMVLAEGCTFLISHFVSWEVAYVIGFLIGLLFGGIGVALGFVWHEHMEVKY